MDVMHESIWIYKMIGINT